MHLQHTDRPMCIYVQAYPIPRSYHIPLCVLFIFQPFTGYIFIYPLYLSVEYL